MHATKVFIIVFFLYIAGFLAHAIVLGKTAYGDGIYYFSWVRSLAIDHDMDFTNEYGHFGVSQTLTETGFFANKYSLGPALLWLPNFLWIHGVIRGQGYEFPYQLVTGLTSVLYAFVGLLLLYQVLQRFFSPKMSLLTILAIAGATNLLFYGSLDTVNSHAISFFTVTLFLALLFRARKNWLAIGLTGGLVALTRTQDVLIIILTLPFLKKKSDVMSLVLGAFLAFSPQLVTWQILYGKFWMSPYVSEGFNFLQPHILGVLFSSTNGLILWTPIVLLGFIGFWLRNKTSAPLRSMALIVLLALYLIASWSTWWQGASYSGRMFVSMLPLIAFGLANLFVSLRSFRFFSTIITFGIIGPLTIINAILIVQFLLTT